VLVKEEESVFIRWDFIEEVCVWGCGAFLVSVWCVLPAGEYKEEGRWGVGFEFFRAGYGMLYGSAHACVVVFGVFDTSPLRCKGGVATARGQYQVFRVKRVVSVRA
jgi:hypothetical protein